MKYWEFLIQKEGDQTWLPLETQQVEILEGRYRVVAHTDRANTPVDIRVSQWITDEIPPRQRVRKRTGSTNESGLVVVMPFVHLKPGQWTLKCSSVNSVEDMLGDGWRYGVELQVFAQSEDGGSDEWPVPEAGQSVSSVLVDEADADRSLVNADLPLLQAQAELQQTVDEQSGGDEVSLPEAEDDLAYQVTLKQQAYLAQRDQPMTIVGKVTSLTKSVQEEASQLWIRLQNPETAGVIMEAHRPLSLARLPADFRVQIQLPNDVKTQVVLGEVSLRTAAIEGERPATVLAATAFTITAGIDQILDAIANQDSGTFEEEISILADTSAASETPPTAEPTVEPTVPSFEDVSQKAVVPAASTILPPKLDEQTDEIPSPVAEPVEVSTIEPAAEPPVEEPLAAPPVEMPPMVSAPAQFVGTSIEDSDLEADEISAVLEDIDKDLRDEPSELEVLEAPGIEGVIGSVSQPSRSRPSHRLDQSDDFAVSSASSDLSEERIKQRPGRKSGREVEANIAFQSLKMKDHFWQRLSNLTHQSHEEATKLAAGMDAAGVRRQRGGSASALSPLSEPESSYSDSEVVIYDEPSVVDEGPMGRYRSAAPAVENRSETEASGAHLSNRGLLDRDPNREPGGSPDRPVQSGGAAEAAELPEMALPVISLPVGDLVAGQAVTVTVRSRPSTYKPFIKLWMVDRQSRSLVIEPKILTNLMPDALGDLQGTTEMQVPMDCLDVQIAAVAIDMATQQESGKAVVNRHVVPASQTSSRGRFKF